MRRCCCNNRKTAKVKVKENEETKKNSDSFDLFMKTFDIREKRIGIVFKVIYVIAALFASVFLLVANGAGKGLSDSYIAYVCLTVFLLQLLYRMIVYIFNELKCLKIRDEIIDEKEEDAIKKQIRKAEDSYTRIFSYFSVGGAMSIIAGVALLYAQEVVTKEILLLISVIGIFIGSVMGNAYYKKHIQFWQSLCSMIWIVALVALMSAMAFEVVA